MHAPLASRPTAEFRPLQELAPLAAEWRALAARAIEPNVFYEPSFALAAADAFAGDTGAVLVRARDRRLIGLFPVRIVRRRYGGPVPVACGFAHPFGPLGAPLADSEQAMAAFDAFLDRMAQPDMPDVLLLPFFPEQGALALTLEGALARRGLHSRAFNRHRRAVLAPEGARGEYLQRSVNRGTLKELRRQRRRLAELNELSVVSLDDPEKMQALLEAFVMLEAAGWKGRRGTAAAQNPASLLFLQRAVAGLAQQGQARICVLRSGEAPIAAMILLYSGGHAWTWKTAYAEQFARFSPGVQLMLEVSRDLLADERVRAVDSCATPGHPMIDRLWRERLALSHRLISLRPGPSPQFAFACLMETLHGAARGALDRFRIRR